MRLLAFLLMICSEAVSGYHVLFVNSMGTRSHLIQMAALAEELLERGHQVTGILFGSLNIKQENYTEIVLPYDFKALVKEHSKMLMEKGGTSLFNPKMFLWSYQMRGELWKSVTRALFNEEGVKQLLKTKPNIDAVITVLHSGAFFGEYFDCPIIQFSPAGPVPFQMLGTGNIMNPSIQPLLTSPFIEPLTFYQRLINHFSLTLFDLTMDKAADGIHEAQGTIKEGIDHPKEILRKRTALVIACSHYVTHGSWPYLPNVIEVGGLHLKEAKPLPTDLKSFMDSATDGVVFVSFGSQLRPEQMPKDKLEMFVEAFRQIEMSVIWKWDVEVPNLPKNVKLSSWLPQQDLLGHPNLRVFVTHGGLGSLVEAIYHKAVIVGIPFSNDQKPNLLRAARRGYAKSLDWENLSTEDLTKGITEAMTDEEMKAAMERIHNLYVDREERPVVKAAWWVEYVSRHKGGDMLRSGAEDIPWYQYHHVDIVIFLSLVILSLIGGIVLTSKLCCRLCCGQKMKTD